MKRRQWTPEEKLKIVMEGLRADCTVTELCNRHQISQVQYYKWRDKLLSEGSKIFAHGGVNKAEQRLKNEVNKLKNTIGDLTVKLNKKQIMYCYPGLG
ncbi:ISCc3, transposase OrfA [Lentisphaera araneosa HTCC2155]|uniref:ISCc3, transposase OrfA n=1 Tax=Lentisphaera araneosa HTCC2155 TaxID=313628 RepID=A6DIG3_9BACT|nr:transposase [Lentisphaera araneosa]EDM28817.1 ISCc3, transposase OrfA [Lentisphaera araneosa HTCC2155]